MLRKVLLSALSLGLVVVAFGEGTAKIGAIDLAKVIQESAQFKEVQEKLQSKFGAEDKKITEDAKALQEEIEKYQKNKVVMRAKAQEQEEQKIKDKEVDIKNRYTKLQKEVTEVQNSLMQDVQKDFERSVRLVAEQNKLDLVVGLQFVIYYNKNANIDITAPVAKKMAEFAKVASTAKVLKENNK